MAMPQKTCTTCNTNFAVSAEEIKFLDKMSPVFNGKKYPLPDPELCPDCRLALRTIHRNEQYFYHNKSAVSHTPLISLYSPDTEWGKNIKIVSHEEWWSDTWDGLDHGQDFDFNRPFFEQFQELNLKIPKVNLIQLNNENCPYTTGTGYCKNCYLINCSEKVEDSYYGKLIQSSRDIMDSSYVYDCELCYQCFYVKKCYSCKYLYNSQNCSDCMFSDNLKGCKNSFLCTNLSNKEYYFLNQPLKKEEYEAKVKEFMGSAEGLQKAKAMLEDLRKKRVYKYANIVSCENSTGDFLTNCKNVTDSYDVNDSMDCKYVTVGVNIKDIMDCSNMYLKPELNYQVLGTIGTYNVIFGLYIFESSNVMYSQFCFSSKDLFGCNGLRNKKYCILNKQYTRQQYEELVPQIIEHMKKPSAQREGEASRPSEGALGLVGPKATVTNKEWGQYFPASTSPFGYNETVANEYLPLSKEQALAKGYRWKGPDQRDFKPQTYLIPTEIKDVKDDILEATLACESCKKNYKIIPQELKRLRTMGMPIPRKCPDCRHMERMTLRNPRKLYARTCNKCKAAIQTTFAPNRPETVYGEACYLESVY